MDEDEFQDKVQEGEEWIVFGLANDQTVRVLEKHEGGAVCKILDGPNEGKEHDFHTGQFTEPA